MATITKTMSTNNSGGSSLHQRRKTTATTTTPTRSKSKQQQLQQQQQPHSENQIEHQNASNEQNERLHFRGTSDKRSLSQSASQPQRRRSTTSTATTAIAAANPTSLICCNGSLPGTAILNCCRDINCLLNAPLRGSVERSLRSESRQSSAQPERRSNTATPTTTTSTSYTSPTPECTPLPDCSCASLGIACAENCHKQLQQHAANVRIDSGSAATQFTVNLNVDLFTWGLFLLAFCTRFYKLATPPHVVFDELHYGKYIAHYMRNMFFFDQHPPLGKQLITAVLSFGGYDGNYTFSRIGAAYAPNVPIFWMRFVPALCGSLLAPAVYKVLLEAQLRRWAALLGGLLVVLDNALLTQSRFVLMESMMLLAITLGIGCLMRFQRSSLGSIQWLVSGILAAVALACAGCIKYVGFLALLLAGYMICRHLWNLLYMPEVTHLQLVLHVIGRFLMFVGIPLAIYIGVFYLHLKTLHRAGPHDSIMTSAFQASLDGGLASITRGQPLAVVHGSQITLRHTHGRTCWLHSHAHVYPVRYKDKRGSSHQQQVTCYSFKDVNNWWIVKRPKSDNLVVGDEPDPIRHGDIIQLVHGITSRALNSHDVAAPMTPQCQEVSCYIDYEIKMEGELLWRVEILNRNAEDDYWHAIKSEIRLIHHTTNAALRYSGRQLPDWGFNQHEVVANREQEHKDAIWNVEEHRYTKTQDQKERERQMLLAEMIPTKRTRLSFWAKLLELQYKMLWHGQNVQEHMYSSQPHEWPLLDKGIAYWMDSKSSAQIYLLGNLLIWYTGTCGLLVYVTLLIFYALRRRRLCYDLPEEEWDRFIDVGDAFFVGYLMHFLPYLLADHTLFLHHYLPAFLFKLMLLCYVLEHLDYLIRRFSGRAPYLVPVYRLLLLLWITAVVLVFLKFLPLSYGTRKMSADDIIDLRWKDTWDFILHRNHAIV